MTRLSLPFLALCMFFSSCPQQQTDVEPRSSSAGISYCSGGQLWLPGHSAPSGPCADPTVVTEPMGDLA